MVYLHQTQARTQIFWKRPTTLHWSNIVSALAQSDPLVALGLVPADLINRSITQLRGTVLRLALSRN